jgi:hypothetical protein
MSPDGGGHDSAANDGSAGGGFSARIRVGRFVFQVGSPDGARADLAEGPPADTTQLRLALSQPEAGTLAEVEEAIDQAESVTGKVERALDLFTDVARGRILDDKVFQKQLDALLDALERADREGRHKDTLRLARALAALLALTGRWVALVTSLRMALAAARALGDSRGIAWALHELGTLALGADDAAAAKSQLTEALRIREEVGDEAGAEVTEHNLKTYATAFRTGPRPAVVAAIVLLLVVVGGVALFLWLRGGDDGPPAPDTTAPEVEITSSPDDPTEETSASFSFEANEPVRTFECRLDEGSFEECVSPKNEAGPLEPGEHVFRVRAIDLAGNVGEPATAEWTIERGEGPSVAITDGPDELTNEPRPDFTLEAGEGAVSLECSLDGGDFESCPNLVSYDVDEGDHTFTARALNAAGTAGPTASYSWTLDTTPPTVEILSLDATNSSVLIEFEPNEQVRLVECSLWKDGEEPPEPEECVSPVEYSDLDGSTTYVFAVFATDAAGNVGEPARREFETDADVD